MVRQTASKLQQSDEWVSFSDDSSEGTGSNRPFLEEYLEETVVKFPLISLVEEVYLSKSGKGYVVRSEEFSIFLWKNNKLSKMLIEALKHYISQGEGNTLAIRVNGLKENKKTKETTPDYELIANKNKIIPWYMDNAGKKYSVLPISESEEYISKMNPLI